MSNTNTDYITRLLLEMRERYDERKFLKKDGRIVQKGDGVKQPHMSVVKSQVCKFEGEVDGVERVR